jgi:hypothetical protein
MRAWGAGVSAGHLVLGALGWLLVGVSPVFFAGCAAVTLALALAAAPLLRPGGDDDSGGGVRAPEEPPPPWWPDFERDFRAYDELQRRLRA